MARTRVLIAGAAGRDFHNFNVVYRDRPEYEVVAFTATQIPNIDGRVYPGELAGSLYPEGIPILPESALEQLVRELRVDELVFAYSDVTHEHVMHVGSRALAAGASYRLLAPRETMLTSSWPARIVRVTSFATTPARRTCAWPMSASSTRSTARRRRESTRCSNRSTCTIPTRRSCSRHRRSRSRAIRRRSAANACWRSKTARR